MTKRIIYIFSYLCLCLLISAQIGAQTCSSNFTVNTRITKSTCLSNGEINVTLGGDLTNIINVQYGLSSESGFSISPQNDNVLRNIPPGTYELTVRAFCKIDSEYTVVKSISNLVVGGTYKVPEVSFNSDASRKSYQECNTGIIAVNVINGSGSFTFTIISAPAGIATPAVVTPARSGNTYTFPGQNYPAGDYTVQVSDGCYTSVKDFTLGTVSGFPTFTYENQNGFRPDVDNTLNSCSYIRWSGGSAGVSNNPDYKRYYNDKMYEIGAAPAGQIPTYWTDWNTTNTGGILLNISPYNASDFLKANSIAIYTRLKGCSIAYKSFTTNIKKPIFSNAIIDRNCDNYTYNIKSYTDYDGMFCYPLTVTVEKTSSPGGIVYTKTDWLYNVNKNDVVALDYDTQYKITMRGQNGTEITSSINYNRNLSFSSNKLDCDSYQLAYFLPPGTHKCTPVEITITDPDNIVVCTQALTSAVVTYSCPLEYGKEYTFTAVYADGFVYTTTRSAISALPTTYTLSTYSSYDDNCVVDKGRLYISANKSWPIGTTFTVTGPEGYVSQTATTTYSSSSYGNLTTTILPPGKYTLTVDHGCGSPVVATFNNPGIYSYKDLGYNNQLTCSGMKITPTGNITYKGNATTTYYRLISGPTGYDKTVIEPGGSFAFSAPGTYTLGILNENSSTGCVIATKEINYTAPPLALDPLATSAYVCVGGTIGNIFVKAINGVAPYTYQLWNEDNTVKIAGVSDITTAGIAHFTHGQADETYTVRISDQCGNSFKQEITISNLQTAKIVYASANTVCTGGTIQLKCITLGNTNYTWTGPNGFTADRQNPAITNAQTNMTGWYKVSVTPEFCGIAKTDSVYIRVTPPLEPTPETSDQTIEVCVRAKATLTAEVTGGDGFYTYQWQSSTNGSSWSNIAGATSASYTPLAQAKSGKYYYRRVTSDTTCGKAYNLVTLNAKSCYILVNPNIRTRIGHRK